MLGRRFARDTRDDGFPLRALLRAPVTRTSRYWPFTQGCLDQGSTGTCVGHAFKHWMMCAPVTDLKAALPSAFDIYDAAVKIDEWADNDQDTERQFGTSVRAAAKVLQDLGRIVSYHWAQTVDDVVDYLLTTGPVVVGVNWYQRMFAPDASGFLLPEGPLAGGHSFLLVGANTRLARVTMLNAWGIGWGRKGRAYLKIADLARLLAEDGEACAALERKLS